jgi:hypothetical protein
MNEAEAKAIPPPKGRTMKPNQKLTHALQDLTAASVENASDGLTLHFEGGSTSRLKGQIDPGQQVPAGASVVQVFEHQDRLELHFRQALWRRSLCPTSAMPVAVRDASGKVVYLG